MAWAALVAAYNAATYTFTFTNVLTGVDQVTNVEFFVDANGVTRSVADLTAGQAMVSAELTAASLALSEGDATPAVFTFALQLDAPALTDVSVTWSIVFSGGQRSADAGDFAGPLSGLITILAGESSARVNVPLRGDKLFEQDETFAIVLSNPSANLTLKTTRLNATILNDDGATLNGSSVSDVLIGTGFDDQIFGQGGNDTIMAMPARTCWTAASAPIPSMADLATMCTSWMRWAIA